MTRTASNKSLQSDIQPDSGLDKEQSEQDLIVASNNELVVANGLQLALIDANGEIVQRGTFVEKALFKAISNQVVKSFCNRFKGFCDADFK